MLNGHGDNGYLFDNELKANFSSNVYFKGPDKGLLSFLSSRISGIGTYPEVMGESVAQLLAQKQELEASNILVTNGATEAFYLLAHLFQQKRSVIFVPSFAEYADACKIYNHQIKFVSNQSVEGFCFRNTDVVWLCNPNNPDGKIFAPDFILQLCKENSETYFILDEAYADFVLDDISLLNQSVALENLVVVRSLTKKYAIPGLRMGYIATNNIIIRQLLQLKMPWSANSMAIDAVKYLLSENANHFHLKELLILSNSLQNRLQELENVEVIPSETSFFLIKTPIPSSDVFHYLLNEHGLLVRNADNFMGLGYHYIRVCTQRAEDNQLLIDALKEMN
jgi:threonine-phosphate decarboxylase